MPITERQRRKAQTDSFLLTEVHTTGTQLRNSRQRITCDSRSIPAIPSLFGRIRTSYPSLHRPQELALLYDYEDAQLPASTMVITVELI